jgi:predicted nucleic acid-binding protein
VIVLDASAALDWLLHTPAGLRIEERIYAHHESLHAPHLIDVEIAQVLRRLVRDATISADRASEAIDDLIDLRLTRYPNFLLLSRIWQLRNYISAYDAAYVALAEQLGATLISRDSKLASVPGHTASVEIS